MTTRIDKIAETRHTSTPSRSLLASGATSLLKRSGCVAPAKAHQPNRLFFIQHCGDRISTASRTNPGQTSSNTPTLPRPLELARLSQVDPQQLAAQLVLCRSLEALDEFARERHKSVPWQPYPRLRIAILQAKTINAPLTAPHCIPWKAIPAPKAVANRAPRLLRQFETRRKCLQHRLGTVIAGQEQRLRPLRRLQEGSALARSGCAHLPFPLPATAPASLYSL